MQLGGVADVHVQRGRAGIQFLRQTAHGHLLQTLGAHDLDGGGDDAVPGQCGLGGTLATAAAALARGVGMECHAFE